MKNQKTIACFSMEIGLDTRITANRFYFMTLIFLVRVFPELA